VVPAIVVVMHEGLYLALEMARQEVIFEQDAVFEGLVCPSSKQMGHLSLGLIGGSGSLWFDVMPLNVGGTSGGSGW
jgi:hypothetical protein